MYPIEPLPGVGDFLDVTEGYGVVEVVRVRPDAIHVFLSRELWPEEMSIIRAIAQGWWSFDQIVLAIRADLKALADSTRAD